MNRMEAFWLGLILGVVLGLFAGRQVCLESLPAPTPPHPATSDG